jgi:hypothetical protein
VFVLAASPLSIASRHGSCSVAGDDDGRRERAHPSRMSVPSVDLLACFVPLGDGLPERSAQVHETLVR